MTILRGHGVDVDEILRASRRNSAERGRLLAERLAHSVLPLFLKDYQGRPVRIGSCVLVRVGSRPYAFTAGHVLKEAGSSKLFASPGPKGKLSPLPYTSRRYGGLSLDVGVLPLHDNELGPFAECAFLPGDEIDENDEPEFNGIRESYFLFGYPASRTQVKVSSTPRHIHQRSFQLSTTPPDADAYDKEGIPRLDYALLEFDHKNVLVEGKIQAPPRLQGVSGGGIFRFNRRTSRGHLIAIAIEHRKSSRLIGGTRIKHFLNLARD